MNATVISATIISIVSITFTVIFSLLQLRHNRNSVRPLCSIYITNYANFISVRIENNGTGPLIIKNIKYKILGKSSPLSDISLYEFLSEIKGIKQQDFHRVFYVKRMTYSISAGSKIYLLSITPENDHILQELRNLLKTMTIIITYTDIYNTEFTCEQNLCDFDKNLELRITDIDKYHVW